MSALTADILLAGAGCAGLSLAVALVNAGVTDRRILLVDPRPGYTRRDRTWCFWDVIDHPFRDCITHRWHRWMVTDRSVQTTAGDGRYAYCHVPGDAFYKAALNRLSECPNVELRLNCAVTELRDEGTHVTAATADGAIRAGIAFDGRPMPASSASLWPGDIWLRQRFAGLFVRTARATFDPTTVRLMDFRVSPHEGEILFIYLLPFSTSEALIEATCITPGTVCDLDLEAAAREYLVEHFQLGGADWMVTGRERGSLPMSTAPLAVRRSRRITAMGLAGGLAKPSTGYAFLAIQRWSAEMAARVAVSSDTPMPPPVRSMKTSLLDRVFLSYLLHEPASASRIFTRLFAGVDPGALVRFLSEQGTLADDLRVAAALPKLRFATEAMRSHRLWMPRVDILRQRTNRCTQRQSFPIGCPDGTRVTTV